MKGIPALIPVVFLMDWWKAIAGFALGVLLCFPLAQCHGEKIGREQMQHAIDVANTAALQAQQRSDALASAQRITDALAINHSTEVLRNAIASTPDTAPDAVRVQLSCARLRASGQDTAHIAACGRSGGGVQAGAAR